MSTPQGAPAETAVSLGRGGGLWCRVGMEGYGVGQGWRAMASRRLVHGYRIVLPAVHFLQAPKSSEHHFLPYLM